MTDLQRFEAALPMFVGKRLTFAEVTGKDGETPFMISVDRGRGGTRPVRKVVRVANVEAKILLDFFSPAKRDQRCCASEPVSVPWYPN